jgi:Flp pilus assembly protein protease CpaA
VRAEWVRIWGQAIANVLAILIYVVLIHPAQTIVVRVGLSIVLIGLAIIDLYRARVPNLVILPLVLAVVPLTAMRLMMNELSWGHMALIVITWATCFCLWWMRAIGGGDAKLVMVLAGIFPDNRLLLAILLGLLVGSTATLVIRHGHTGLRRTNSILVTTLSRCVLPTRAEIRETYRTRSSPVVARISAGGLLYLWWIW